MVNLARKIAKELDMGNYCAVHRPDLNRVWPDEKNLEQAVGQFAQRYGWRVIVYKDGRCAIFEKDRLTESVE